MSSNVGVQLREFSYRQLEPASYYTFRIFARNDVGIGKSSPESEQLHVPASLPDDPFYTKVCLLTIYDINITCNNTACSYV
jgi:hypothetical protein